jgi:hypothetical protein
MHIVHRSTPIAEIAANEISWLHSILNLFDLRVSVQHELIFLLERLLAGSHSQIILLLLFRFELLLSLLKMGGLIRRQMGALILEIERLLLIDDLRSLFFLGRRNILIFLCTPSTT